MKHAQGTLQPSPAKLQASDRRESAHVNAEARLVAGHELRLRDA
jgi:hypothetical protein